MSVERLFQDAYNPKGLREDELLEVLAGLLLWELVRRARST